MLRPDVPVLRQVAPCRRDRMRTDDADSRLIEPQILCPDVTADGTVTSASTNS